LTRCLRCWHYRRAGQTERRDAFFEPRPMDVERLRNVIPSIVPVQRTPSE
jgi:uncharacterized Fe-S cluster-containing radical SAM superfamily protein